MPAIQQATIKFFAPDNVDIPDTIGDWDSSKWPGIADNICDTLEIVAYELAAKHGLTVTID